MTRRLESRLSMMIVVLGLSVFPPSCEGLKLENYMHTDKSEVIASSAASLSKRQPKFFFRSTSTVTSTTTTTTTPACFTPVSLTTPCAVKRRRRSVPWKISRQPIKDDQMTKLIRPSKTAEMDNEASSALTSSNPDQQRDPRLIFFLSTTTITSTVTSTSTSSTTTFTLTGCIPLSFPFSAC